MAKKIVYLKEKPEIKENFLQFKQRLIAEQKKESRQKRVLNEGAWDSFKNFFKRLFGSADDSSPEVETKEVQKLGTKHQIIKLILSDNDKMGGSALEEDELNDKKEDFYDSQIDTVKSIFGNEFEKFCNLIEKSGILKK
jgi:hypothetical protein